MNTKWNVYGPVILAIVAMVGMTFGMKLQRSLEVDGYLQPVPSDPHRAVEEAFQYIEKKYYGDFDRAKAADKAIYSMVDQLDDYSYYFTATNDQIYEQFIQGYYEGLGMELLEYRDSFFIGRIIQSGPAHLSGLKLGDLITKVDTISILNNRMTLDSLKNICSKPMGSQIHLEVFRHADSQNYTKDVEISDVSLPLITSFRIEDTPILYIHIERFSKGTFRSFMDAIDAYKIKNIEITQLIIDLRGNPGGLLDETIKILNQLVDEPEQILVTTRNQRESEMTYKSNGRNFVDIEDIIVLLDEHSASASEILAGSLQDLDRAVILGEPSFGKGLIQQNYKLSNGSSINLTVGEYLLPSGRKIDKSRAGLNDKNQKYFSLRKSRPLESGIGIVPDTLLPYLRCKRIMSRVELDDLMNSYLIKSQFIYKDQSAFDWDNKYFNHSDLPTQLRRMTDYEECRNYLVSSMNWNIWQLFSEQEDMLPETLGDRLMQYSIDILLNSE